jgi:hypothetical protein
LPNNQLIYGKNEQDIIEPFIRHNLHYVDLVIGLTAPPLSTACLASVNGATGKRLRQAVRGFEASASINIRSYP